MGITGELVRSVFSKSHSIPRHEKRKWSSSVRSYLCGDEHSSLLAADDSASIRNSTVATEAEADFASFRSNVATDKSTGTRDASVEEDAASETTVDQPPAAEPNSRDEKAKEERNSTYKLFRQEDAALIIQSAFRNFMARRARDEEPPSRESIGTSVEVQTAHSCGIYSTKEERDDVRRALRRRSTGAQVLKIQEDWDDSTVSSVISKMRMQNRLEAATRRERALAYAFSQQLRICSKKQSNGGGGDEANMGWSWLERWMAARQPEMNKLMGAVDQEKESCGSNEVSSLVEFSSLPISLLKNVPKPTNKARTLAKRSFSRQSSTSSHLSPKESKDVKKVMWHVEEEKEKRKRQKQPGFNKKDAKNATALEVA